MSQDDFQNKLGDVASSWVFEEARAGRLLRRCLIRMGSGAAGLCVALLGVPKKRLVEGGRRTRARVRSGQRRCRAGGRNGRG